MSFWRVGEDKPVDELISSGRVLAPDELPINKHRNEILYSLERNSVVIIIGQTGSGKTTQIPKILYEGGWTRPGMMIGCTQPRKLPAISVANRVANELNCGVVGGVVGYCVRFDDCTTENTRIKYLTDGILLREILFDPLLSKYSVIMIDEAHERSLHTDLILALLKRILVRRPDLRIIIASATIDAEIFKRFFTMPRRNEQGKKVYGPSLPGNVLKEETVQDITVPVNRTDPVILSLTGRPFPVEIYYLQPDNRLASMNEDDIFVQSTALINRIHEQEPPGDILVFLTGKEEIDRYFDHFTGNLITEEDALRFFQKKKAKSTEVKTKLRLEVMKLYAGLSIEEQLKVFEPTSDRDSTRRLILATNIAEASVTIDGIVYVVDSGRVKVKLYDETFGLERMVIVPISKASAKQRAGRAGRTRPGKAYRLYSEEFFESMMSDHSLPELLKVNLVSIVVQLKALGLGNLEAFDFVTKPTNGKLKNALKFLKNLEILDGNGKLSDPLGRRIAELPLDPQLAKFFLEAVQRGCPHEGAALSAILTIHQSSGADQQVIFRSSPNTRVTDLQRRFWVEEGDHLTLLNVMNSYLMNKDSSVRWSQKYYLNLKSLTMAHRVYNHLMAYLRHFQLPTQTRHSQKEVISVEIRKSLIKAYYTNIALADQVSAVYSSLLPNLRSVVLNVHPTSVLFKRLPNVLLYGELLETSKVFMRYLTVIEPEWLLEILPDHYEYRRRL